MNLTRIQSWLSTRSTRERHMLIALAWFLPVAGAAALGSWAHAEHVRLSNRLPVARAEFERVQENATELARLRAAAAPATLSPADLTGAVQAAAAARGLRLTVEVGAEGLIVRGEGGLPALIDWLSAVHADHGVRPSKFHFEASGRVEAEFAVREG